MSSLDLNINLVIDTAIKNYISIIAQKYDLDNYLLS